MPVKPGRKRSAVDAAADWVAKLGATGLAVNSEVPPGVRDAFCAHVKATNPNTGEPFKCDSGKTELLTSARSKLVYFRYRFDFHFCGTDESYRDAEWSTRPALASLLKKRAASLSSQRKWKLAERTLEALVWLTHDPATVKEIESEKTKAVGGER